MDAAFEHTWNFLFAHRGGRNKPQTGRRGAGRGFRTTALGDPPAPESEIQASAHLASGDNLRPGSQPGLLAVSSPGEGARGLSGDSFVGTQIPRGVPPSGPRHLPKALPSHRHLGRQAPAHGGPSGQSSGVLRRLSLTGRAGLRLGIFLHCPLQEGHRSAEAPVPTCVGTAVVCEASQQPPGRWRQLAQSGCRGTLSRRQEPKDGAGPGADVMPGLRWRARATDWLAGCFSRTSPRGRRRQDRCPRTSLLF